MASNTWAEQQWLGSVLANGAYRTLSASNCGARIRFSVSRKNVYIWMPGGVGSAFMSIHEKLVWRDRSSAYAGMLAGGPENISFIEQSSAVEAGMLLLGSVGALRKSSAAPTILSMPSFPGFAKVSIGASFAQGR